MNYWRVDLARRILVSLMVNVTKNPEFLSGEKDWPKLCERNMAVARCILEIDKLKKIL